MNLQRTCGLATGGDETERGAGEEDEEEGEDVRSDGGTGRSYAVVLALLVQLHQCATRFHLRTCCLLRLNTCRGPSTALQWGEGRSRGAADARRVGEEADPPLWNLPRTRGMAVSPPPLLLSMLSVRECCGAPDHASTDAPNRSEALNWWSMEQAFLKPSSSLLSGAVACSCAMLLSQ